MMKNDDAAFLSFRSVVVPHLGQTRNRPVGKIMQQFKMLVRPIAQSFGKMAGARLVALLLQRQTRPRRESV
ncbi:hypothetical protein [Sinorhizobium fredii]|uniref:hypothetical protein n=1 Tax=Rhizobium fredii TaxID=380 RepID=UPI0004B177AD|nr:hypothetical protein [Sinorhizobium fredii]